MQDQEYVAAALRALAEQDGERQAPEDLEIRLRQAFRRKQAHRRWRTGLAWSLAAAAAITVVFVAGSRERPKPVAPARAPRELVAVAPVPAEIAVAPSPVPARRERAHEARPVEPQPVRQTQEVVTQFFSLLDVAPPFERGELLRVTVPASTMRRVGLPVNEDRLSDRVYADVLVGQEGLARAIRFVSYQ
jgi:hypothetical protein